jgi:tetratricopeptide (TPR) repeat protein
VGVVVVASLPGVSQTASVSAAPGLSFRPTDPLNHIAFDHFYNMEYDRAVSEFEQILQRHPDDAFAINHYLVSVLFTELYRMGTLNTGEYTNDTFVRALHRKPDGKIQQQIQDLVQRALKVEEAQLNANPNDVSALYARGVTRAQFATYTGLMEHAWFSAMRNAVGARHDHERVLELAPQDVEAKLVVGTHLFVMGNLPWSIRTTGGMFGLSGNKEKGLQYLRDCAAGPGETATDAQILLVLFLRREHRFDEALPIDRELIRRYPHNLLLALEEGNLLRGSGHNAEAATVYRRVWQAGKDGKYQGLHYEVAALSLGDFMRALKDYPSALEAYEQVGQVKDADEEILQKANLGAGETYDLQQNRDMAVAKYKAVMAADSKSIFAVAAEKYLKEPYREQ